MMRVRADGSEEGAPATPGRGQGDALHRLGPARTRPEPRAPQRPRQGRLRDLRHRKPQDYAPTAASRTTSSAGLACCPVQRFSRQQANLPTVDARLKPIAVILDFVDPLRTTRWLVGELGKAWLKKGGRRARAGRPRPMASRCFVWNRAPAIVPPHPSSPVYPQRQRGGSRLSHIKEEAPSGLPRCWFPLSARVQ
jgi:hypothetical protein